MTDIFTFDRQKYSNLVACNFFLKELLKAPTGVIVYKVP